MRRPGGRRLAAAILVGVAALAACGSDAPSVAELTVAGAWARTSPPGAANGVVYVTVTSPVDDAIVGVSVPADVAGSAELHETMGGAGESPMANMPEMAGEGAAMTMVPLAEVALPAGTPVVFEPGGKHIMLVDLEGQLVAGDSFPLSLTFESGVARTVDVTVGDNPPGS